MIEKIGIKKIVIGLAALLGLLLMLIAGKGFYTPEAAPIATTNQEPAVVKDLGEVKILTTEPSDLNGQTVLPTAKIVVNFDTPMVAFDPNYHVVISPKADVEIKSSSDQKSIIISPKQSWAVGTGYNLMLKNNLKFQGNKSLGQDVSFDFHTLAIKGI